VLLLPVLLTITTASSIGHDTDIISAALRALPCPACETHFRLLFCPPLLLVLGGPRFAFLHHASRVLDLFPCLLVAHAQGGESV
jgi:hypothetical protein